MEDTEALIQASRAIDEANLPEDLRPAAFAWLLARLTDEPDRTARPTPSPRSAEPVGRDGILAAIGDRLRVSADAVAEVFHETEDGIGLSTPSSKLAPGKAGGAKEIALLIASGRQASVLDSEWTPVSEIRDACKDYNRFDQANFASTITEMADVFSFRGRGPSREVRVSRPGWEAAASLVRRIAGEDA